mmetsp:Transcript_32811/g.82344  ORF Transcript_32811/g.82344 Transcript_32811/m.82344 type:complete len:631 (-) Transcript_32811:41-1933(-)
MSSTAEEVARREEERLSKALCRDNNKIAQENAIKARKAKQAAEERATKDAEEQARLQAAQAARREEDLKKIEAARQEREQESNKLRKDQEDWLCDDASWEKKEQERIAKRMGIMVEIEDDEPAPAPAPTASRAVPLTPGPIQTSNEAEYLEVQREQERLNRHFGGGATASAPPLDAAARQPGAMGSMATPSISKMKEGETLQLEIGPPSTMSSFEMEVWSELNKVRMNPAGYAKNLENLLGNFDGWDFLVPGFNVKRRTQEGRKAMEEAIFFLKNRAQACPMAKLDPDFSRSALDLCVDQGPIGGLTSLMSNGTEPSVRLVKYGKWRRKCAETISYGAYSAKDVIHQWLTDDGHPQRENRLSMLDPDFTVVGIASGRHSTFLRMVVCEYAADFVASGSAAPEPVALTIETMSLKELDIEDLKGSDDGRNYVFTSEKLGVPKQQLELRKEGPLLHLQRTTLNADGTNPRVANFKWTLPFPFSAASVVASYDPTSTVLTISVPKPGETQVTRDTEVATFEVAPEGTRNRVTMADIPAATHTDLIIRPSTFTERITLKLLGQTLSVVAKHNEVGYDDQGEYEKVITSSKKLTLPFFPNASSITVLDQTPDGRIVRISNPTAAGSDVDTVIPIN